MKFRHIRTTGLLLIAGFFSAQVQAQHSVSSPNGEAIFGRLCSVCHGIDAAGDTDFFPSLLEAAKSTTPNQFARVILNGKYDSTESSAGHNMPLMPPWSHLGNEDIAALTNYLYRKARITTTPLQPADVANARGERWSVPAAPLSDADFMKASSLYFNRCAGCHGVDRQGSAGNPLSDWQMRSRGDTHIREILHYGTPWGMPNWGTSDQLSSEEMSLLSRFLQRPAPKPPAFTQTDIKASWKLKVPVAKRPKTRQFPVAAEDLFASIQHDSGRLLLISAKSKKVLTDIDVGVAPHDIDVSLDGRYLYLIRRDGHVVLIDLFMEQPGIVAEVRVGLEARSIAVNQTSRPARVLTGSYWPEQYSILNAHTLEPIRTKSLGRHGARISQITNLPNSLNFILATNDTNNLHMLNAARSRFKAVSRLEAPGLLRGGSFDSTGRYFLIPQRDAQVVVLDSKQKQLLEPIATPSLQGGSVGVSYEDPIYGAAWASSSMQGPYVVAVGTNPKKRPDHAWKVIREVELPSAGSLFIGTHPSSSNLWVDLPLSASPKYSEAVMVIDQQSKISKVRRLPIVQWAGLTHQRARVLHPQFNAAGDEVWLTVWSRQDRPSAIVVVDDKTLELKTIIQDTRLITPIRTFSLGAILRHRRSME